MSSGLGVTIARRSISLSKSYFAIGLFMATLAILISNLPGAIGNLTSELNGDEPHRRQADPPTRLDPAAGLRGHPLFNLRHPTICLRQEQRSSRVLPVTRHGPARRLPTIPQGDPDPRVGNSELRGHHKRGRGATSGAE